MQADKIMDSSLLDVVFDGRNKEYGAYQLRKGYNLRLFWSLVYMAGLTGSLFATNYIVGLGRGRGPNTVMTVMDVQLEDVHEEKKNEPLPPPPPPPVAPQQVATTRFTAPRIVRDNEVKEDEKPPEQEKLADTKIGAINQEGVKDEGIVAPPGVPGGNGVVETPKPRGVEDYDRTFTKVEIESEYPGGIPAWMRYLNKNFRYPEDAINNEIQGTVVVQFIVDKDGNVSDVEAVEGPSTGGLREEAVRVIRQSGKWIPAIQNGRQVKSYKKQPVVFKLAQQQ